MQREEEKKPGLVPFSRFFAVLGYVAFSCVVLFLLAEGATRIVLPIYHRIHYYRYIHGAGGAMLDSESFLSQRRGIGKIGAFFSDNIWLDLCSASPAYAGFAWAEDYWKEQRMETKFEKSHPAPYEPLRVWGMWEWHGKFINLDPTERGARRRTVNALQPGCASRNAQKVWVFGASNAWGLGDPDFATIQSYLSKKLNAESDDCVEVVNLGVDGYVTNQEVVYLMQQLKAGGRPDAVIFFDGYCDAFVGAVTPGIATTHWDYNEIRAKYQSGLMSWPDLVKRSDFLTIVNKLRLHSRARQGVNSGENLPALVKATMDNYESNLHLARMLAKEYGFDTYFFWQPYVLYGKKPLDPFEQTLTESDAIHAVYEEADRRAAENRDFIFLGRVFDQTKEPVYIDTVHLGPRGNEIIAGAMASQIEPGLRARKANLGEASKVKGKSSR
jgi:lysophospholipase L1-like esterase